MTQSGRSTLNIHRAFRMPFIVLLVVVLAYIVGMELHLQHYAGAIGVDDGSNLVANFALIERTSWFVFGGVFAYALVLALFFDRIGVAVPKLMYWSPMALIILTGFFSAFWKTGILRLLVTDFL